MIVRILVHALAVSLCGCDAQATPPLVVGGPGFDFAEAVAVSNGDAVAIAGWGERPDVGQGTGYFVEELFLLRVSTQGEPQWSRHLAYPLHSARALGVTADSATIAVVGWFDGPAFDFGGGPGTELASVMPPSFEYLRGDAFVATYSSEGDYQWAMSFGGWLFDAAHDVALGADQSVVFVGNVGTADLAGDPSENELVVATLAADGQPVWWNRYPGTAPNDARAVALDPDGNVYVAGRFGQTLSLGGEELQSAGGFDGFVLKLSPTGTHLWSRRLGGPGFDTAHALAVDEQGSVTVTGTVSGLADLGAGPEPGEEEDAYLVQFSVDGVHQWSHRFEQSGRARGVAVDGFDSQWLLTGWFQGSIDLGDDVLSAPDSFASFAAAFDDGGAPLWSSKVSGSAAVVAAGGVALEERIIVVGGFEGTLQGQDGDVTSAGGFDAFAARLLLP